MKTALQFHINTDFTINDWNEETAEITGRPASAALGKKYYDVLPRIFVKDEDALALAIKERKDVHLKRHCFNGLFDHELADIDISPSLTPNGKIEELSVSINPISPRKKAYKTLSAEDLSEIGNRALAFAHGMRNPLNAIKGAVVYLHKKYAGERDLVEFTKIMEVEISRIEDLISKFLSSPELSVTDINTTLKKIEKITALQAKSNNIEAVYKYGNVASIMISPFHLEQVILNLINNAMEAMRTGGHLKVRSYSSKRSGKEYGVIEISDTGPGIVDGHHASAGKGYGLSITQEIVRRQGGHLEIKSRPSEGTKVKLYLQTNKGAIGKNASK